MRLLLYIPLLTLLFSSSASGQVTVDVDETVTWYIENLFQGEAVSISNITINGLSGDSTNSQVGSFENNGAYLPLSYGVVLSSGGVLGLDFVGDSVIFGEQTTIAVTSESYLDEDLEALTGEIMNDVVSIGFDFVPEFEFIMYDYAFGSEEYPEYVNSFNDAFGFFISGPGIVGPYSSPLGFTDGSVNIALIPNTTTPVTIDNVNNGNGDCFSGGPTGPCMNCEYYLDNCAIENMALDGMTTQLLAYADVIPGETYHIKLALGDALDGAFDSAVLLKESSFRSSSSLPAPTGIHEPSGPVSVLVTNPVDDHLILRDIPEEMHSLSLFDLNGREVTERISIKGKSQLSLDVHGLESGLYLLRLQAADGKYISQQVIKE